jgi:hypothetical protein
MAFAWVGAFFFLRAKGMIHVLILLAFIFWLHGLISISQSQKKYMMEDGQNASS